MDGRGLWNMRALAYGDFRAPDCTAPPAKNASKHYPRIISIAYLVNFSTLKAGRGSTTITRARGSYVIVPEKISIFSPTERMSVNFDMLWSSVVNTQPQERQ
jgi:hypothetical protein